MCRTNTLQQIHTRPVFIPRHIFHIPAFLLPVCLLSPPHVSLGVCRCSSGCEVSIRPRGALEKLAVAHGRHQRPGSSAVEGPEKRGLEGQGVLPLVPAAPPTGWIHQVRQNVFQILLYIFMTSLKILWSEKFDTTLMSVFLHY